jgi:hypothetical protein
METPLNEAIVLLKHNVLNNTVLIRIYLTLRNLKKTI